MSFPLTFILQLNWTLCSLTNYQNGILFNSASDAMYIYFVCFTILYDILGGKFLLNYIFGNFLFQKFYLISLFKPLYSCVIKINVIHFSMIYLVPFHFIGNFTNFPMMSLFECFLICRMKSSYILMVCLVFPGDVSGESYLFSF